MNEDKIVVRLNNLHCYENDEAKFDDVFLKFKKKRIWPLDKKHEDVRANTKHDLGIDLIDLSRGEEIAIEVWDHDVMSANDLLGTACLTPDKAGGPFMVDMKPKNKKDTARYSIVWQVLYADQL